VLQREDILEELTCEPAEYENFIIVALRHACALPRCKISLAHLDNFPAKFRVFTIESLNRVTVLLGCIRDSRKNVHPFISQCAGGMVVTTVVKLRQVEPNIQVDIVLLHRAVGNL
jgi:hypothetical protein